MKNKQLKQKYCEVRKNQYGYRVGYSALDSYNQAKQLLIADDLELEVCWSQEPDNWLDFVGDIEPESTWKKRFEDETHEVLYCWVEDQKGNHLAGLGGIVVSTDQDGDDYKKSVEYEVLSEAVAELNFVSEDDIETEYDDFLDEIYGDCNIAGYQYSTASTLKEVDPIAYRQGLLEYIDGLYKDDQLIGESGDYYYKTS